MHPEVERFLREKVRSPLRLAILMYFHRNPYTMDYAEGTAMRLGLHPELVSQALEKLAEVGLLQKRVSHFTSERPPVYRYTRDFEARAAIAQIAQLLDEEPSRLHILALLHDTGEEV